MKKRGGKVLITVYGGLNGFEKERLLEQNKRGVSRTSFNGIQKVLKIGDAQKKEDTIEIRAAILHISKYWPRNHL